MNMNPSLASASCSLFEELATGTWERIMLGMLFSCSQGENTITDLNLLELHRSNAPGLRIYKAIGRDEPKFGFDWEWFIGKPGAWYRFSVQAKKLDVTSQKYKSLRHKVAADLQLDILKDFSIQRKTIPLYCFYNYVPNPVVAKQGWNCGLPFHASQLGCTIAPLHIVEHQHQLRASKDFSAIHAWKQVFPWRCLFCCPALQIDNARNPLFPTSHEVHILDSLPSYLHSVPQRPESINLKEALVAIELPEQDYASNLKGFPQRIGIFDLDEFSHLTRPCT